MDAVRIGKPTSSTVHRLMNPSKKKTYIKEKSREMRLGIEIGIDSSAHSLSWGKAMEGYVYENHIEIDYELVSQQTTVHPSGLWCGTKDIIKDNCVGDIKCPISRTSFCDLIEIIESQNVELFKLESPEYYWQLVSNSILENCDYAELVVWMPYVSEHAAILEYIEMLDDFQMQLDIHWVLNAPISRLPMLPGNSGYKNINRFKFEVPKADKIILEETIKAASKLIKA